MVTINQALLSVKTDLAELLSEASILACCRRLGHRWRDTLLNPAFTLHLFIMQILADNTACAGVRHLAQQTFTASAYCQARQRLPLAAIQALTRQVGQRVSTQGDQGALWHGHRVWLVDGSSASMPDTPELQAYFGQPGRQKPGCGFPVAATLMLMHAASGAMRDLLVRPLRVHDMSGVAQLHEDLHRGDVLVGDRAFASYVHLCLLGQRGLHGIFRLHQRMIVSFRPWRKYAGASAKGQRTGKPRSQWVARWGRHDQVVRYFKPKECPAWISREQFDALPESILVREILYQVGQKGFRTQKVFLVTTLLNPVEYPVEELAQQFRRRWTIEGNFNHLKTTLGAAVLHSKTVAGVIKELWVFVLVYNLIRQVMLLAARRQEVEVGRISFADALRWLSCAGAAAVLCELVINPLREGRFEPRVIKRRKDQYPWMNEPRAVLRQQLIDKRVAA